MRKSNQLLAISCSVMASLTNPVLAASDQVSAVVPNSAYVHTHFPACGTKVNIKELAASAGAIATFFGSPYGGAIAAGGALWDEARKHGGEISKLFSRLEGGDKSSCMMLCARAPNGQRISRAQFLIDDRLCGARPAGGGPVENEWYPGESIQKLECGGGWAGWESLAVGSNAACGTAANWKHDRHRTAVINIVYD